MEKSGQFFFNCPKKIDFWSECGEKEKMGKKFQRKKMPKKLIFKLNLGQKWQKMGEK